MNKPLNWMAQWALARADSIAAALTLLAAGLAAMLLAGCGGGDEPIPLRVAPAPSAMPVALPTVQLEGCVVDDFFQPRSQTPVQALAADGRLLGNAQSGPRGEFKLRLPAGQSVSLAVDRPDGEVLKVVSGLQSRVLATCLVDPSA